LEANIKDLLGKTLVSIDKTSSWGDYSWNDKSDILTFITLEGEKYQMYHKQSCCENVGIEDIEGELNDLLNSPILQTEESTNSI
jgi:hypothetical protein